jgi:hypothetical protein
MPTIISGGAAGTAATLGVTSELKKISREDRIWHLEPEVAPLTLMLRQLPKGTAKAVKEEWLETEFTPQYDQVNNSGGYTAGATSVVVDNGAYFPVNSILRVQRTGETMLVTAVSTNTLTVTRSFGGTAAAALVDNDHITRTGGAAAENATSENARQVVEANAYNMTQIFTSPFGASRSLQQSDIYGPKYMSRIAKERGGEHKRDLEMAMFFGERADVTSGNYPRRAMGGVHEWISTNSRSFGGALTLEELFDFAEDAFRYGSMTKTFFVARAVNSNISLVAKDFLRVNNGAKELGLNIKVLETPSGTWNIVPHPLLEGDEYAKIGFSLDMKQLQYVALRNSDTKLHMNIQENDRDGEKHQWLTECTLKRRLEKTCAVGTAMAT